VCGLEFVDAHPDEASSFDHNPLVVTPWFAASRRRTGAHQYDSGKLSAP
jgi:hypothetical protein